MQWRLGNARLEESLPRQEVGIPGSIDGGCGMEVNFQILKSNLEAECCHFLKGEASYHLDTESPFTDSREPVTFDGLEMCSIEN